MAVWSVINLAKLYGANRLDAECYAPTVLQDEKALDHCRTVRLGDVAFVTDGQHGYHEVDPTSPVRHITAKCVQHGFVTDHDTDRLALATHEANKRSQLRVGDVLLSTAGTIGEAGLVGDDILPANIDQDVARIALNNDPRLDPAFLVAFLNSEFGRFQCDRATTGQMQFHISLGAIRDLRIPVLARQKELGDALRQSIAGRNSAASYLAAAETMLNNALGLTALDLTPRLFYEARFADTAADARLDAEYFTPRMQNLIAALFRDGRTIADVATLAKRHFKPKPSQPFDYIEIADVTVSGTVESKPMPAEEAPSRAQWIVKPGDIITSTVRPIRRLSALIQPEQSGFVCSSGFAVLQPKDIEPEVLLTYLRLPLVCELLDLHTTASMYPAISTGDILRIPISLPDKKSRQAIAEKVRESFAARKRAQAMLKTAKRAVEIAIGESEAVALRLLKEERG
jgi:hypothetical protein